jgi:hypothetical protein
VASARCPRCAIDYPTTFRTCLVKECRATLHHSPYGTSDANWEARVKVRNGNGGIEIRVDRNGQCWVSGSDVELLEYAVTVGDILDLGGTFYEVNGYSRPRDAYWLEEVIVEGAAESLEPHMFLGTTET